MFSADSLISGTVLNICLQILIFILVIFITVCFVWTFLLILYYKIHVGEPPIKGLQLAYKYSYLGRSSTLCFKKLNKLFPEYKLVKLCYCGPNHSHVEYANCVILSEIDFHPDIFMMEHLLKNGLSLFKIPKISHAISLHYPTIPWFPMTRWLAIAIAYPKLFKYVQEYNLCAYPVLEIYNKLSVIVMIPLLRQDEFVVKEAERLVNGRQYSAMLSPISISPHYLFTEKKLSKTSSRVNNGERKG